MAYFLRIAKTGSVFDDVYPVFSSCKCYLWCRLSYSSKKKLRSARVPLCYISCPLPTWPIDKRAFVQMSARYPRFFCADGLHFNNVV
jgi:hypothetical protein